MSTTMHTVHSQSRPRPPIAKLAIALRRVGIQSTVRLNRVVVLAALLAFLPAAMAQQSHPALRAVPRHTKVTGIANFGEVTATLYRGAQPNPHGLENLKKMGVSIVVDMRGGNNKAEESAVTKLGMQYVPIPWHCPFPTDKPFARFLKVIDDNPGKKIFVHCRLGDDRTGLAVASYRMANEGWSADEAMNEMKEFGFTGVHRFICPGIAPYEKQFPSRFQADPAFKDLRASGASTSK